MNSLLNDEKITETGATAGVQTLATRPNQPSVYGVGGLSASELKKKFDRLADAIITKHNALCDALGGKDAPSKIGWKKDDNGAVKTLADFFATITSGYLADILMVGGLSEDGEKYSLADTLKSHLNVLIFLYDYLESPNQDGSEHISDKFFSKSNGESLSKKLDDAVSKLADAVLKNLPSTAVQSINGSLSIGGHLFVKGTTYTVNQQTVIAKDNIIVTNAVDGANSTASGIVINKGDGTAYGILYMPEGDAGNAVYIGEGTLTVTEDENGDVTDVKFEYYEEQALPLAARSEFGATENGFVPVWDSELNAFVPGNFGRENEAGLIEQFQIEHPTLDESNEKYHPHSIATVGALKDALANVGSGGGKVKGTQGVAYELDSTSQEYYVSHLSISSDEIEELVFADYIDGIPVTKIKTYAFEGGFPNLKRIEIPGTIREIEPYAFSSTAGSTNSVKIIMHPGVEIIGANAFLTFASSTVYAVIPSTVSYIGKGAFAYPTVEYTRDYAKLIFVNPYHWIGKKINCKNKKYAIEPRFLSSDYALSAVNAVDLTLYDYIYNEFLTEEE